MHIINHTIFHILKVSENAIKNEITCIILWSYWPYTIPVTEIMKIWKNWDNNVIQSNSTSFVKI
jgi:hypothetical protein